MARIAVASRASSACLYLPKRFSTSRFSGVSRMFVPGRVAWEQATAARQASRASLMARGCRHKMRIGGSENAMEEGFIDVGPADLTEGELRGLEVGERLVLVVRHQGRITAMDDSCNHAGCLLSGGWLHPRKGAVVCPCSDTRTAVTDDGGRILKSRLADQGHAIAGSAIVPDDPARISQELERAREASAQVVLISGGTGITSRDSTFEAVSAAIARPLPGFGELFRMLSFQEIGSAAMLSRAVAGVTPEGLIVFALPGSPAAVRLACDRLILPELGHLLEELGR